jgi:hypothetical protein
MPRRVAVVTACGLVQVVRLHWRKSARGGQGTRHRNAVPQAFIIPDAHLADLDGALCIDESHWGESNHFTEAFQSRWLRVPVVEGYAYGCVRIYSHADGVQIRYQYDRANAGAPDRWFFNTATGYGESPTRQLTVQPGQWARICYNGRFSCFDTGNWWYEQVTVNVAWFVGEPDGRIFVDTKPDCELRMMAHLR